jgi:hypothetical protein
MPTITVGTDKEDPTIRRVVVQGEIGALTRGGPSTLLVATGDDARARMLLASQDAVVAVADADGALRVRLDDADDPAAVTADLNRRLVEAHLDVTRLEPAHASLEQRFLEVTTRLENAA